MKLVTAVNHTTVFHGHPQPPGASGARPGSGRAHALRSDGSCSSSAVGRRREASRACFQGKKCGKQVKKHGKTVGKHEKTMPKHGKTSGKP